MAGAHSDPSPSGLVRALACPGSRRLVGNMRDEDTPAAARGSRLHAMTEAAIAANLEFDAPYWARAAEVHGVDEDDLDAVRFAVAYARTIPGTPVLERRLDFWPYIHDFAGTPDFVSFDPSENVLHVVDWKFGRVKVAADGPQLKCYGGGAQLVGPGMVADFDEIRLHIVQPALFRIDSKGFSPSALEDYVLDVVKPGVAAYRRGDGPLVPGPEQCEYCPAGGSCRARAEANLQFVDENAAPETLSVDERGEVILRASEISKWLDAVILSGTAAAIEGQVPRGTKLVEAITRRRWRDEAEAGKALAAELTRRGKSAADAIAVKVVGLGAAEKLLGKGGREFVAAYAEKPKGAPVLVPDSDPRADYSVQTAETMFQHNEEGI